MATQASLGDFSHENDTETTEEQNTTEQATNDHLLNNGYDVHLDRSVKIRIAGDLR